MKFPNLIILLAKKIKPLESQPKGLALSFWDLFKTGFSQISYLFFPGRFFTFRNSILKKLLLLFFGSVFIFLSACADYTVGDGVNIDAASLVGQSGVLTINGTVTLSSDVTLSEITNVIINAPNGKIYWSNNSNLIFSAGSNITINNSAPGLQASGSNGAQRLYIGNAIIAVSSDNANNADFSFAEFNQLGGLPKYNINSNSNVCSGSAIISSVIPAKSAPGITYNFSWSITPSAGTFTYNSDHSISNIFPANGTYTITCIAIANTYETIFNFNITVSAAYTWKGINTNWSDVANWCPGIPGTAASVTIPPGVQSPVILLGNTASVYNINIDVGASLTVNGTLQVAGSVLNSGTLDATNGTIEMKGTSAQTIAGSVFTNKSIKNLIISNTSGTGLSVSSATNDTLKITGALTFGNAGSKLNTGDNITLVSNSLGTARVGIVGPGNSITGKVIVERYINIGTGAGQHGKSWQFLAVPTDGQTIKESWMEDGDKPDHYGTMISGPGGTAAGFDIYSVAPSMKIYNYLTNNWTGVSNTNNPILDPHGYFVFVRGDRTVTATNQPANSTILRTKGTLFTGNLPSIEVAPNTFQSVGNPYASPVDFSLISKDANVDDKYYVWDPYLYGSYGLGGYQTISSVNGWIPVPGGTAAYPAGVSNSIIQSGQAFFVHSTVNASFLPVHPVVSFSEDCKSVSSPSVNVSRKAARVSVSDNNQYLRASLFTGSAQNSLIADGNSVVFNKKYSDEIDGNDAEKMLNSGENFGVKRSGKLLSIEAKAPLNSEDTIYYNISNLTRQTYQLIFAPENIDAAGLQGFLVDKFLNTETPVSLTDSTLINITITSNSASSASDRFKLIFRQMSALPVNITSITATAKDPDNIIQWGVANESGIKEYEIEKSADGNQFNQIQVIKAVNSVKGNYEVTDKNVNSGANYYRIKIVSVDGKETYTEVVKVINRKQQGTISVYPNPINDNVIHLQLNNQPSGIYKIKLYNAAGQVVISKNVSHAEGSSEEDIKCDNLPKGIYQLQVTNSSGNKVIKIFK